jgi:2-polyprenyl-3-methyl-5-hydroxy-6-metoxy-1,4-benzoquinol methylase
MGGCVIRGRLRDRVTLGNSIAWLSSRSKCLHLKREHPTAMNAPPHRKLQSEAARPDKENRLASKKSIEAMLLQLLEAEKANTSSEASRQSYLEVHRGRFADILRLCRMYVPNTSARVLDIGRSELTAWLLTYYHHVETLGLDPSADDGGHREASAIEDLPHITFDLLNSCRLDSWPECGHFDLIVFSEVLEHLSIAPEFVFAFLGSLLAADGTLICSTPNAADIAKRLRLACGRNPYERLRLYSMNPGHIREYTRRELCEIARRVGLNCARHFYFDWPLSRRENRIKAVCAKVTRFFPPFRGGSVTIFRKARYQDGRS